MIQEKFESCEEVASLIYDTLEESNRTTAVYMDLDEYGELCDVYCYCEDHCFEENEYCFHIRVKRLDGNWVKLSYSLAHYVYDEYSDDYFGVYATRHPIQASLYPSRDEVVDWAKDILDDVPLFPL